MAVLYGKNYGKPTLDLNFAGNKSLVDTTTGTNYVTFSRAQSANEATYVGSDGLIKYAAADEARFDHDPETGESLGLLIEESRTNLLTYSEAFNSTNYSIGYDGGAFIENAAVAPDGTLTASKLTRNAGTSGCWWGKFNKQAVPVTNGVPYTLSCFLKAAEITEVNLNGDVREPDGLTFSASFTLTGNGSYVLVNGTSAQITPVGNNWYRCSVTGTANATTTEEPGLLTFGTGASGDGFFAWGFQLEAGSSPRSYIPTSGSTVTRSADVASITGTNFSSWYNQSEGTIFTSVRTMVPKELSNGFFMFTDGTVSNRIEFRQGGSGDTVPRVLGRFYYLNSTTTEFLTREEGWSTDGKDLDNWCLSFDNTGYTFKTKYDSTPATGTGNYPQNLNNLSIGHKGTISRLSYYPKRLPDIELQQLTK